MSNHINHKPIKECGDCRFFNPENYSHLCEKGSCHLNIPYLPRDRSNEACEFFKSINNGELS